ncbi:MAG: serine/threonine protein kinase [Myxococcales bacterium]|nr:serine/threonine protein kinase [Myxococcales bacterium]
MAGDPDDTDPAVADTHASAGGHASATAPSKTTGRGPRGVRSGDTLGRYELGEELGEGGMATVFKARDTQLRRDVAVKVLFPHLARREEVVRRFHREARAAAGLEHANILRIYDVGGAEGDDPPYIVMEMIRGRSLLAEIEQRGPMFPEVAACVGALLADALAAAHKASIVHRDMKPANVMIAPGGRILLTDFGVARLETEDSLVTKTGAVLGTPAYMSPEQASGDTATAKSDLYSLGATLYQLATGTLPYGGSPAKVLAQIASGSATPAVKKRPAVGPDLSRVIERLMAVEPEARIATAAATATELRAIAAAGGLGEPADELAAYFADPEKYVTEKTPKVVAGTVAAAKQALSEGKLPRALALADRAGSLAPADPAVTSLIARVAEGDRASRRNRLIAIGAAVLLVGGGGGFAAYRLLGSSAEAPADAAALAMVSDAALALDGAPQPIDTAPGDIDAAAGDVDAGGIDAATPPPDAAVTRPPPKKDAGVTAMGAIDAAVAAPQFDAAPLLPVDAAPAAKGTIVVRADSWCDVTVDGQTKGQLRLGQSLSISVEPGPHTVVCAQTGTDRAWTRTVEVPAGGRADARGDLIQPVDVSIEVDATIDGVAYQAGTKVKLKGYLRVKAGGAERSLTFTRPCRLRTSPTLDCYP